MPAIPMPPAGPLFAEKAPGVAVEGLPIKLPLGYRPNVHDDWGFIRDAEGHLFAVAKNTDCWSVDEQNRHRVNGTDPCRERAESIVRAVNAHDALVGACQNANRLLENLWKSVPWGQTFDLDIALLNAVAIELPKVIALALATTPTPDATPTL